ncbi:MAG: RNA polymerase sigma-70 factor [Flavobacteriaceae bacterium]
MYKLKLKEFKFFFDELYIGLCLFGNKYIDNMEVSKDIVQDVFIKVWEDEIDFNNEKSVKSYLYTAVKNKCLDYVKSKHYKNTSLLPTPELTALATNTFFLKEVVVAETSTIIENAVNTLPKKCARIIFLSIKGFSNTEIAKELSITLNTVKAQKKIAYKKLRPMLKQYFELIAFVFII